MVKPAALTGLLCLLGVANGQVLNPPQWDNSSNFLAGGLVRASDGNYYRALHDSVNKNPVADDHSNWELYYVRANTILNVAASGARFSSLKRAWGMAQSATVAAPATLQISISTAKANFSETFVAEASLNAVSGARMSIVGDNAAKISLNFSNATNGFSVTDGSVFGGISGVTIDGSGAKTGLTGVLVDSESSLLQSTFTVQDFVTGIQVDHSSRASCEGSQAITCRNGVITQNAAIAHCNGFFVDGKSVGVNGFVAVSGAQILASQAHVSNLTFGGYEATASTIIAASSSATNTKRGYTSAAFGFVDAVNTTCSNQSIGGFQVAGGGRILATNTTLSGNATDFNIPVNTVQTDQSFIGH